MCQIESAGGLRPWAKALPEEALGLRIPSHLVPWIGLSKGEGTLTVKEFVALAQHNLYAQGHYTRANLPAALDRIILSKSNGRLLGLSHWINLFLFSATTPRRIAQKIPAGDRRRGREALVQVMKDIARSPRSLRILWEVMNVPVYPDESPANRAHKLDARLRELVSTGKFVLADVGCAAEAGAPTTVETAKAFPSASVIAVDVHDAGSIHGAPLENMKIPYVRHNIGDGPLPFKADVIRMSHLLYHFPANYRRKAILHAIASLDGGRGIIITHNAAYHVETVGGKASITCSRIPRSRN